MRVVVDTNVVAYYVLRTAPFFEECAHFWRTVDEPIAPASWRAELVNVLWMAVRKRLLDIDDAVEQLERADLLGIASIEIGDLWAGALWRAHASGVSPYDTLFVELAEREAIPLATFDQALARAFPRVAVRPRELMIH